MPHVRPYSYHIFALHATWYARGMLTRSAVLFLGIGAIFGLALGFGSAQVRGDAQVASILEAIHPVRLQNKKYSLINPLVAYETPEAATLKEYQKLKDSIQNEIDAKRDDITTVSVYYRNLNTGDWIGINQNAFYYPASLLKVPVMIAFFRAAETDPSILKKRIVYQTITSGDTFDMQSALIPGTSYTVNELVVRMIVDSDNGATYTLLDHIDQNVLDEVYTDLGITKPDINNSASYQISTRTYALFFRILYNATYLTPEYSQKALELLSRTTYTNGLDAGVPEGTTIVHKYGEHVVSSDRETPEGIELHDCGIVYHPKQHYLLCIMTNAPALETAQQLIGEISKTVYDAADKN